MASKRTRRMSATVAAGLVALALGFGVWGTAAHAQVSKAGAAERSAYFDIRLYDVQISSYHIPCNGC